MSRVLRDTDPDKVKYKGLLNNLGREALHALYPKDFEAYFIALELVNSKGFPEAFITFPVQPSQISESQPTINNIKKTAGGVVNIGTETFIPRDIEIKGNFGRNLRVVLGSSNIATTGFLAFFNSNPLTPNVLEFSAKSKTGYGSLKIVEDILESSERLDGSGRPKKLILYNPILGNNYIVKKKNFMSSQNISENMIPQYTIQLTAVAPFSFLQGVLDLGESLTQSLNIDSLDSLTNQVSTRIKDVIGL